MFLGVHRLKKGLTMAAGIAIILFLSIRAYGWYSNSKLVEQTNHELKALLKPFINNTIIKIVDDEYLLRIHSVELPGGAEVYKKSLNSAASVTYGLYKKNNASEVLFDVQRIDVGVWRTNPDSSFNTNARDYYGREVSYIGQVFDRFVSKLFMEYHDKLQKGYERPLNISHEYSSSWGGIEYLEDSIQYDNYGNITSSGKVFYRSVHCARNLAMEFNGSISLSDFKGQKELMIAFDMAEGEDYHPLWNLRPTDVQEALFFFENGQGEQRRIRDKAKLEQLTLYLRGLSFEKTMDQKRPETAVANVQLGKREHYLILSPDGVYTNHGYAFCQGEEFSKRILEILE